MVNPFLFSTYFVYICAIKIKKMENKEQILDYQLFYEELIEKEYLPSKIDYNWTDKNEDFMKEVLFAFYTIYVRYKDPNLLHPLLKLYSEVILAAFSHYPEEEGYF